MKKIILILLFIGYTVSFAQGQPVNIHFIDIGEGDAILIQAQGKCALIDTGNLLNGYKLIEYLEKNNVKNISYLIISHPDPDHIGGIFFVLPKFKIENLYDNGCDLNISGNPLLEYYEKAFRKKENYQMLREGDRLNLGEVTLEVIWPRPGPLEGSFNHNSLVIMLSYKNSRCLLTADIDEAVERELLNKGIELNANILKVAHHGAADASSDGFIEKVSPEVAVISVDKDNPRGYPAKGVLDRLAAKKIKAYRSDKNSSVVIRLETQGRYSILP